MRFRDAESKASRIARDTTDPTVKALADIVKELARECDQLSQTVDKAATEIRRLKAKSK